MNKLGKFALGFGLLLVAGAVTFLLVKFKREAKTEAPARIIPSVEVIELQPVDHKVVIPSQGIIEPITQTRAASEVAGLVVEVSEKFEAGESFETGDVLLKIDATDYEAALAQAQAALEEARLNQEMEEARRDQALRDWEKLKSDREPTGLVQRIPQVRSAAARVAAAEAAVKKANRDLERTELRAPYPGRIKSTSTDLGSYVTPGAPLAELYRTDVLEIRLPISLDDYAFIENMGHGVKKPLVNLRTVVAGEEYAWTAQVVRTEGQTDRASRSVFLVARIDMDALGEKYPDVALDLVAPGLFVKADIDGVTLKDVYTIPRKALFYAPDTVVLVDDRSRLALRRIKVKRSHDSTVLIDPQGLEPGQKVCVTALETVIENMEVNIPGKARGSTQATSGKLTDIKTVQP